MAIFHKGATQNDQCAHRIMETVSNPVWLCRDVEGLPHRYLKPIPLEQMDPVLRLRIAKLPEVSEDQVAKMLHAIGADHKRVRMYQGRMIYHAYRNYYDAGGADVAAWDDLVSKGYAQRLTCYGVTPLGLDLLELLTGRSTIYDDFDNYADCRLAVLTQFLSADVYCGYGCWMPTSAATVAKALHIPLALVREACRNLASEGYIEKGHYGEMDDDGAVHCCHGYFATELARQLPKWKELHDAEMECINRQVNMEAKT